VTEPEKGFGASMRRWRAEAEADGKAEAYRFDVLERDCYTCSECGRRPPEVIVSVERIRPKAIGGTEDADNLHVLCRGCRGGAVLVEDMDLTEANALPQMFYFDHQRYIISRPYRRQVNAAARRYIAEHPTAAGRLDVVHRPDGACCRREPWPTTQARLIEALNDDGLRTKVI